MVRVNLSDGVAAPVMPRRPAGTITAPPAKIHYDAPRVSTTNGRTGQSTPYAGTNPTPIQTPAYNPAPAPYVPPYQPPYQPPAQQQFYQPWSPPQQSFAQPEPIAPPPPPPPPKPPVGGREWYMGLDNATRAQQDTKWLGGDSDYTDQIGQYDKALAAFVDRIAKQKALFETDANEAVAATNKNEGMTLNNLGEDFGARGLSYSGLFNQESDQTASRFGETRTNIGKNKQRNVTDATNREADYRSENQVNRGNARRAALQRMAAEQALKDANAGF